MKAYVERSKVIDVLHILLESVDNSEIKTTLKIAEKLIMLLPIDVSIIDKE